MTPSSTDTVPPLPSALVEWLRAHDRQSAVIQHGFDSMDTTWWNQRIADLPGSPLVAKDGATTGSARFDREHLFEAAEDAVRDDSGAGALRLLWRVLRWGDGRQRNMNRRIASVKRGPVGVGQRLQHAAQLAGTDPTSAFELLAPRGRNAISYLGPAFFTKYLYFAGGGAEDHPSLIVDTRVLTTLKAARRGVPGAIAIRRPAGNYSVATYQRALTTLGGWAGAASASIGRRIAADEVERWAFSARR